MLNSHCGKWDEEHGWLTREQERHYWMELVHLYRALNQLQASKAVADMEMGMIRERIIEAMCWTSELEGSCLLPPIMASSEASRMGSRSAECKEADLLHAKRNKEETSHDSKVVMTAKPAMSAKPDTEAGRGSYFSNSRRNWMALVEETSEDEELITENEMSAAKTARRIEKTTKTSQGHFPDSSADSQCNRRRWSSLERALGHNLCGASFCCPWGSTV
jgi:hypothetical protein